MKFRSRVPQLCLILTIGLTLIGVGLRTAAMFTVFDTEVGYFDTSILSTLITVCSFVAAILPLVLAIITPKHVLPEVWHEPRKYIAAIPPFVCFILCGAWTLYQAALASFSNVLLLCSGVLSLLSALYALLVLGKAMGGRIQSTTLSAIGYAPIFWALISIAETYTDQFTTINSPIKLGLQFGFLGVMLFTVSELRFRLDKPLPRAALCFHAIAVFFCLTGSIPTLVALSAGILDTPVHTAYALGLLGAGIYAAARLTVYVLSYKSSFDTNASGEASKTYETDEPTEADDPTDVSVS